MRAGLRSHILLTVCDGEHNLSSSITCSLPLWSLLVLSGFSIAAALANVQNQTFQTQL